MASTVDDLGMVDFGVKSWSEKNRTESRLPISRRERPVMPLADGDDRRNELVRAAL